MNRIKKKITVRFFSMEANDSFMDGFVSICKTAHKTENDVRIVNIRGKKHFIKINEEYRYEDEEILFLSVVRERNTWQVKALGSGEVSGIKLNQGIVGDPYYLFVLPKYKTIIGFTTGVSGSLKSVANSVLQQFNTDRTTDVRLDYLSKTKEFSKLKELEGYNKLHFKVDPASIVELNDDAPGIIRELSSASFMSQNSLIALTFTEIGEEGFAEKDVVDIVNYLSENEGCSALTVQGLDSEGKKVHLDFSKAYAIYKTEIYIRGQYVDEKTAKSVLQKALNSVDQSDFVQ